MTKLDLHRMLSDPEIPDRAKDAEIGAIAMNDNAELRAYYVDGMTAAEAEQFDKMLMETHHLTRPDQLTEFAVVYRLSGVSARIVDAFLGYGQKVIER